MSLQTPNELGHEQTEKVVSCLPDEGFIDAYSQVTIDLKFYNIIFGAFFLNYCYFKLFYFFKLKFIFLKCKIPLAPDKILLQK